MNHPRKRAHSSCLALLLAGAIAFAPWTSAKAQVSPKGFGIGADVMLSAPWTAPLGVAGLALNIWATPALLLQFLVQSQFVSHRRDDVQVLIGGGGGLFYTIARGDATALEIGGRFGVGALLWTNDRSEARLGIDALLRVEHWLDRHFSVSGQVGIATAIAPEENEAQPF
ncbi:MAG: hypothetical protein NZM37_09385, partial [Sandaracinaceae bacterium]|nr:hypothetical protein [Sandaracinaceae bacterium]